ncbi:MAG: caspase family protein, partial [Deltaproteobacteria bacterium]|nr:caspase family protein [Deltaproteobacteria bacterium]
MRLKLGAIVVVLAVWAACPALAAERTISRLKADQEGRVALVIGNSAYQQGQLRNPVNDARAVAKALKGLGFEVMSGENLDYQRMRRLIVRFGRKIDRGGVGLFYFAGHGVQSKGRNYLIPVNAPINYEEDLEAEAVDLASVLAKMAGARNGLNIVILDACRNNPFARTFRSAGPAGLAQVSAPRGTFIAYATSPGKVAADGPGQHGLFTESLIRHINRPGLTIERLFKAVR